jgi:hypothetical protein
VILVVFLEASLSVSPFVSGAQANDTSAPSTSTIESSIIVTESPYFVIIIGSAKVLIAEPRRLIDVEKPTPRERTSVGKLSAGKTPTRLLTADRDSVNPAKITMSNILELL